MVRVVLCSLSAWERVDEEVRVDCRCSGVLSIDAIMREVSAAATIRNETQVDVEQGGEERTSGRYCLLMSFGTGRANGSLLSEQKWG